MLAPQKPAGFIKDILLKVVKADVGMLYLAN